MSAPRRLTGTAGTDTGQMGQPCPEDLAKGCGGEGGLTLVCEQGFWQTTGQCPGNYHCDSTPGGDTFGTCMPVIQICATKRAGDAVCTGFVRKTCSTDLIRLDPFDCQEFAHCEETTDVHCECDPGYKDDGAGNCVPDIKCPANSCKPGGQCVPGATDWACECDVEYEGTGTKACMLTGPCVMATICSEQYVCRSRDASFVCRGQFADWPMPSTLAGAKVAPNYMAGPAVVTDAVTGLTWERMPPPMYPNCTASGCSRMQAVEYCETLALEGRGWRLPTLIELTSILDDGRIQPSIDAEAFPGTAPSGFWSASFNAAARNEGWIVNFGAFKAEVVNATSLQHVRCVR